MFSEGHVIFIFISAGFTVLGIVMCNRYKPPVRRLFVSCLLVGIVSEIIKVFVNMMILPVVYPSVENGELIYKETGDFAPYLEAEHFPFELCSLQIPFLILALVIKNRVWLKRLYSVMYSTCIIGGVMAIILSSATIGRSSVSDFVTSADVWRSFLYHSMLIVLGVYIGISRECDIRFKDIKWTYSAVICLDFVTLYLNSMMAAPYYSGDTPVGIGNVINYFSSYNNPLGIPMKNKTEWAVYLLIRFTLAAVIILLVNLPLLRKERSHNE